MAPARTPDGGGGQWHRLALALLAVAVAHVAAIGAQAHQGRASAAAERLEREYVDLYEGTEDKVALEAIRDLHRQLDGDNDGTIEPAETGEFMRGNLYQGNRRRGSHFHAKDAEITVKDLWVTWRQSEVFNWTAEQVADWVENCVELPQYRDDFLKVGVNGTQLPKVAASPHYLSKVVGISSPIHRSKLTLKAMDVVLFGAPREHSNFWKDTILTSLLLLAVTGLFYAYHQNKRSKGQLKKMMADLDSLAKAEETLKDLQEKLHQKDSKIESLSSTPSEVPDPMEINRLREELDVLRSELQRAEVELEDKCWMAPPVLQHWLQLTYEMESVVYNAKRKTAEEQMEMAKDMCEKLKRKRSSLIGAFVSTHGRSIDDVDRSILDAKTSLMEVTRDLQERSQRWRQIEMLCGCSITKNPGIGILQGLVRHVGVSGGAVQPVSRLSRSGSQEDLEDHIDGLSVAPSSSVLPKQHNAPPSVSSSFQLRRRADLLRATTMSREMSKESSSEEEMSGHPHLSHGGHPVQLRHAALGAVSGMTPSRASTPPVKTASSPLAVKRSRMVKSFSQDAGGSIQTAAASAAAAVNSFNMAQSAAASCEGLASNPGLQRQSAVSSVSSGLSSVGITAADLQQPSVPPHRPLQGSKPSVVDEADELSCCSASETGSLAELTDGGGSSSARKAKDAKRRSFFHFRKKEKKALT